MSNYKITYFDARGIAEASRMVLHYANVEFVDERISMEDWKKNKMETPFGQLPMLTLNGKTQIAQSSAIARFLAKRHNLAGKDDVEAALLDSYADLYKDWYNEGFSYIYVAAGFREGDKDKLYKEVLIPSLEKFLPHFIKAIKNSGSGFLAKSGISWVDFLLANGITTINFWAPEALKKYPELLEHNKKVHSVPQLKKYLSGRKEYKL